MRLRSWVIFRALSDIMFLVLMVKSTHCYFGKQITKLMIALLRPNGDPWWLSGRESACQAGDMGSIPGSGRRKWQPTPVFLPGESHGQKIQVGYSLCCVGLQKIWTQLKNNNIPDTVLSFEDREISKINFYSQDLTCKWEKEAYG